MSVLGDYGRMERKSFMGIAQIKLDDLNELNSFQQIVGWYKLFHSNSLVEQQKITTKQQATTNNGTLKATRKDSEQSLRDIR